MMEVVWLARFMDELRGWLDVQGPDRSDVRQHDGGWILSAGDVRISAAAVISLVVGAFCRRWLIRLLVVDRLHWLAIYCLIVGSLTIAWQSGLLVR